MPHKNEIVESDGPNIAEVFSMAAVGDAPYVQDLRDANDGGLSIVPRLNTFADLVSWVNVIVDASKGWNAAPNGALVWRCVGFYIRSGAAVFIPKFINENGTPASDVAVAHSWPGAPSFPANASVTPSYAPVGVIGLTNANGDIGFGYSGGMVYTGSKPFTGPGLIWPLCPTHLPEPKFADCAAGLGWFGGTDHTTVNPVFQLVRKASTPVPPIGSALSLALFQNGVDIGVRIAFVGQITGSGWEMVLLDENNQILGSSRFV